MASLVEELQRLASDGGVSAADLLRKAKLVAAKLGQDDLAKWIDDELNGTFEPEAIPEYRRVPTRAMYSNPYHGMLPFVTSDGRINAIFSGTRPLINPMRELEELLASEDERFFLTLPETIYDQIRSWGIPPEVRPMSEISRTSIAGVTEAVRNRILDWSLELERRNVMGAGMSFSSEERQRAREVQTEVHFHGNIGNFSGVLGSSSGVGAKGVVQSTHSGFNATDVNRVIEGLRSGAQELLGDDRDLLNNAADTLEVALGAPGDNNNTLRKALAFVKALLPRVATWATKSAVETGIHNLMPPPST